MPIPPDPGPIQLQWPGKHTPLPAPPPALTLVEQLGAGAPDGWRNRLMLGDNRDVLRAWADEFAGQVACVYIDPPFATGATFKTTAPAGAPQPAYSDDHGGLAPYLQMMYERLLLLRPLLSAQGSLFVHLDWHAAHYVKLLLDEVFGVAHFRNEIVWRYRRWPTRARLFQRMHDTIFWYSMGSQPLAWHQPYEALSPSSLAQWGGKRRTDRRSAGGTRYSTTGEELSPGVPMSDVWEIPALSAPYGEYLGYATQKPEALIARILAAVTNPGDLVADCFCGAGTLPAVAEGLGRRWLACDAGALAVHLTRKRLLALPTCTPFDEYTLATERAAPDAPPPSPAVRITVQDSVITLELDEPTAAHTDYWAVDPAYTGRFCPTWRSYRTRARPTLQTTCTIPALDLPLTPLAVRHVDRAGHSTLLQIHPASP